MSAGSHTSSTGHHGGSATWVGIAMVLATLLSWSSVPLFVTHFAKSSEQSIDLWTSNGWRYGMSALLWLPVIATGLWRGNLPAGLWRASVLPATFNTLGQVAFAYSFYKVDPATATFGLRLQIVFIVAGAYLMFPAERRALRNPWAWVGIVMVLGGIAGTFAGAEHGRTSGEMVGIASAVASGMLFAAYGLAVRRNMHPFHPVTAFAAISQITAVVMLALMVVLGEDVMRSTDASGWDGGLSALSLGGKQFFLLFLSAMLGIAVGHVLYYYAIARLGVAVSSGVVQIQPFGVAVGQYFLFDQPMTKVQLVTGVIAVFGAVLLLYVQWWTTRVVQAERRAGASRSENSGEFLHIPPAEHASIEPGEMDALPIETRRT